MTLEAKIAKVQRRIDRLVRKSATNKYIRLEHILFLRGKLAEYEEIKQLIKVE